MNIFDEMLMLRGKIKQIKSEMVQLTRETQTAKGQVFSDMPKGGVRLNSIEEYVIEKETLEHQKKELETKICKKWIEAVKQHPYLTTEETKLMKYRFFYGLKWSDCTNKMSETRLWNENKTFRTYRNIMHKIKGKDCA